MWPDLRRLAFIHRLEVGRKLKAHTLFFSHLQVEIAFHAALFLVDEFAIPFFAMVESADHYPARPAGVHAVMHAIELEGIGRRADAFLELIGSALLSSAPLELSAVELFHKPPFFIDFMER